MPEEAQPQGVTTIDPVMGGFEMPNQAPPVEPAKETAPVAEAPATPEAPETPATPEDPLRKTLEGLIDPQEDNSWDDSAKSLFEKTFGEKDPMAYLETRKQKDAEFELFKKDAEEGRNLKAGFGRLSPAAQRALQLEMEGKDAVAYLRSLPDTVLQNKEAKELTDKALIDTYKPGMISQEEWAAKASGDFDELNIDKDTLDYKIKSLRQMAEIEHEGKRGQLLSEVNQAEQSRSEFNENYNKAIAASYAAAQSNPILKTFAEDAQTLESFRNGTLDKGLLTLDDGITPSPNKFTTLLKAQLFDRVTKLQYEVGFEKGRQAGLQELTSRMPMPTNGNRAITSPTEQKQQAPGGAFLDNIEQGIGRI